MKHLWLILFVIIIGCVSQRAYPEEPIYTTNEDRRNNAVLFLHNGKKIKGVLDSFNYENGDFKFISTEGGIYDDPTKVYQVEDIWGTTLLYKDHINALIDKKYELGLVESSGKQLEKDRIAKRQPLVSGQYEGSYEKKSQEENHQANQVLGIILNDVMNIVNPSSTGKSSARTCQYDGYELRKTFDSKLESAKIAYKWECIPFGTHTYWIVE